MGTGHVVLSTQNQGILISLLGKDPFLNDYYLILKKTIKNNLMHLDL